MKLHLIYAGYGLGQWKPEHRAPFDAKRICDDPGGISGTELQVFGHARELTRRGHDVTVYSRFIEECEVGGIAYRELDTEHERCDVAIAYHDGRPLDGWKTSYKVALHQTYLVSNRQQDGTYTGADFADLYLTASERVAAHLRKVYGWKDVRVVPNGWDLGGFLPATPTPGRLVFTTSVDRGAKRLIEVLPEIMRRVPEAHVVMLRRGSPGLLGIQSGNGIGLVGPLSRNEVLGLLATAYCFAYPCDVPAPTECFPVSVLEACGMGVPVVLAPDDGIEEIFRDGVWLTPPVKTTQGKEWQAPFVDAVVDILTNELTRRAYAKRAREFAGRYTFQASTDVLCRELGL